MTTRRTFCSISLGLLAIAGTAHAQDGDKYPSRPIRMLVPNTAGSTSDVVARMFADRLAPRIGQPVVVENKPGAGGLIAAQAAAKSPPDGYTILFVNSQHAINPAAYEKLPYDTLRDFEGIVLVGDTPSVITVAPQLGVRTVGEFIALAKRRPGELAYASGGVGSQTHLSGAYFASLAGISISHVPYRSASEVLNDLVSNRTQATFAPAAYLLGQIQAGKLQPLAVTGRQRLSMLPSVPTVSEAALPDYEFTTWLGFIAPAKTPPHVMATLARELKAIAEDPTTKQKFAEQGITPRILALKDFDAYIKSEVTRLSPIVVASGVKEKP
jgi:tripartite-type tricarboxylate transporter receptor subunit TctC